MSLDPKGNTQPCMWHLLLQNNWYRTEKLSPRSKSCCKINLWYQICATRTQNCVNVNESSTVHLWVLRVGRSYRPCHMPSSDSACSLHLFPLRMPRERGVQHGVAFKRHCRERTNVVFLLVGAQSFGSSPLARCASSPWGFSCMWITTHGVKISWSCSGGFPMIFFFLSLLSFFLFSLLLSSNVTDRGHHEPGQEIAVIISDGIESGATQKRVCLAAEGEERSLIGAYSGESLKRKGHYLIW